MLFPKSCPEQDIWTAVGQRAYMCILYNRRILGYIVILFLNHYFSYHILASALYDSFISSNTYSSNICLKHLLWVLYFFSLLPSFSPLLKNNNKSFCHFGSLPLSPPILFIEERLCAPKVTDSCGHFPHYLVLQESIKGRRENWDEGLRNRYVTKKMRKSSDKMQVGAKHK